MITVVGNTKGGVAMIFMILFFMFHYGVATMFHLIFLLVMFGPKNQTIGFSGGELSIGGAEINPIKGIFSSLRLS